MSFKHNVAGKECTNPECWCFSLKFNKKDWNQIMTKLEGPEWDDNEYWQNEEKFNPRPDMVGEPPHYKLMDGKLEAIDLIKDVLSREEFLGYLRGTLITYHIRANRKNGEEDLRKAAIYNSWLIEELDAGS